jgi:type I restriction enzyme S subunit
MGDISTVPIGEVADVTKLSGFEYTDHFEYTENGEIIALRALNVRDGTLDLTNIKRIRASVSDNLPRSKLYKWDILFTYVGANIGQFAFVPENDRFHLAPNICRIRCGKNLDPYYLYSYFRTTEFKETIEGFRVGSSQPTMPMGNIRQIPIPIRSLLEQKAIAEVLSSLDDKIDLLHRQNKTLESLAATLFRHSFIDGAQDDWEIKPLDKIADYLNGLACQKYPPKNPIDKLPVLKIRELRSGFGSDCDWATSDVDPKYLVRAGDIIFSWSASLMVKIWDGDLAVLNQHLFKVTSDEYPDWFIYLWTQHHMARFTAIAETKATTMGHIKRGDLSASETVVPDAETMKRIDGQIAPLFTRLKRNSAAIRNLETLRDTLLPKLMSGEVCVESEVAA